MGISSYLTEIATGLGELVPAFLGAFVDGFVALFITTTGEGSSAVTTLSPVGTIAILFLVIGMVYKIAPTVMGWLQLAFKKKGGKGKKRK